MWYDKHRPTSLDDYVWMDTSIRDKLLEWIDKPLSCPNLILSGPTGTGKTTLAVLIRDTLGLGMECKFVAASMPGTNGIDMMREVVDFCEVGGFGGLKMVILDEADRLSRDAQQALRNLIDRYQEDVRFILTCNYLDKIIEPLQQGRMWVIEVAALDIDRFADRIVAIAEAEQVDLGEGEVLAEIIDRSYPNMRRAISDLQYQTRDGKLSDARQKVAAEWENSLLEAFRAEPFSLGVAREVIAGMSPADIEYAYRLLYEQSGVLFGPNETTAIPIIAEYLFRNSMAGLPDITLCACLVRLEGLRA